LKTLNNLSVNDAQYEAITFGDGAMLVLAGPGSGKTFTVTQRIEYLIEHHNVNPEDILVITFTKAAAMEMQERFVKMSGYKDCPGKSYHVNFGTFHAIFFKILRYTYKFTAENIIREGDKYRFLKQVICEIPDEIDTSPDTLQRLLAEISKVKNNGITPQDIKSETVSQGQFELIFDAYKQQMNRNRLIDFDDMVLLCRNLLADRPDTLKMWQNRFKYILVDEFQDICPLQYEVVRMIAEPQNNLFIVGDDDQSIYGFRGSKPEIMLNFGKDYPNARQVVLNINYRSKKDIIYVSQKLITHNKVRFDKQIDAENQQAGGVKIFSFKSKLQQAQNIVLLIKQYMQQPGAKYSDIAILYRTNSHTLYTADRLMHNGIPFVMKEKPRNIYEEPAVKDVISYIRYSLYEDSVEDFFRIMNRPVRYIKRNTVPLKPFKMQEILQNNKGTSYAVENIIQLYDNLKFIKTLNPYAAVNYIRKGVGYDEYIKKQARENGKDASRDFENLDELLELSKGFETLKEWLEHIENYDVIMAQQNIQKPKNEDAVNIVTMHASKGLEWKVVVLPDVNEGVVPHKKAITDEEIEEERRMFYVAMTRAKENLFIFYLEEKGAGNANEGNLLPSRFIDEIQ
jgi:DNA helicase-2/ATP-dependent DNA helicase PcrA